MLNNRPVQCLWTLGDLVEASGLSASTIRRRVKEGSIPAIQPGGRGKALRFLPTVLEDISGCSSSAALSGRQTTVPEQLVTSETPQQGVQSAHDSMADAGFRKLEKASPAGPQPNWMRRELHSS